MSMIPEEIIEQVRDAADLVGIVGESVQLKRTGADYRGACPFHGGTHRNFSVIPRKGLYYCFVCHEGGDIFTWLMKRQGLDYPTAVREVARRVGIVIPDSGPREGPDPREPLFQAAAMAQEFYARRFQEGADARDARDYLESRGYTLAQAGEWGLGFAPRGPDFLAEMDRLGVDRAVMLEAGLLHRRDDGNMVPRFRGRLLFPIHDLRGRVVGFGGRLLGPGEPKYLNSPESPIFKKGGQLYHLHVAKQAIRKEEAAIVVEGYFDVLRLYAAGIEHVVAPLGTSLTAEQAGVLRRFARTVILLYDSDRAGLRATFRAGDELLRHGVRVRVATMPEGEDPDTLVRAGGAAALTPLLRDAMDVLERKLHLLEQRGWFGDVAKRHDALDRLLPTVRAASDPVVRDLYLGRVAERVGIGRDTLERELRERPAHRPEPAAPAEPGTGGHPPRPPERRARHPGARQERALLQVMLAAAPWRTRGLGDFREEDFEVPAYRTVFAALRGAGEEADLGEIARGLPEPAAAAFSELRELTAAAGLDLDREYEGAAERLRERAEFRRVRAITDPEERRRVMAGWPMKMKERYAWQRARERAQRSGPR
jgi:DNA primase